jgi:hypothetical protein
MGEAHANDPNAMPLGEFISDTMDILKKPAHGDRGAGEESSCAAVCGEQRPGEVSAFLPAVQQQSVAQHLG